MSLHLAEISSQVESGHHAVVILYSGGCHQTGAKIEIPANIALLHIQPYSPELNPVEDIWRYLRENRPSTCVFAEYGEIINTCNGAHLVERNPYLLGVFDKKQEIERNKICFCTFSLSLCNTNLRGLKMFSKLDIIAFILATIMMLGPLAVLPVSRLIHPMDQSLVQ
jgi:hypothetical protein